MALFPLDPLDALTSTRVYNTDSISNQLNRRPEVLVTALNMHDLQLEHLDVDVSRVRRGLMLLLILLERVSIFRSVVR
jgi:hypothetical protein